ncbi:MAG: hypothetical protein Q8L84_00985 [Hyphomonas sp.]|nr:hypothetical protein [Hyphomonas sp.]
MFENKEILEIPKKCLNPYRSYQFTLKAEKGTKAKESTVIIIVSELDIPPLKVEITEKVLKEAVSVDEEISLNITYQKQISLDKLIITLTFIYKDEIVSISRLPFTKSVFRI